jgi:hypothetical protein
MVVMSPLLFLLKRAINMDLYINEWYAIILSMMVICKKLESVLFWILLYLNIDFILKQEQCLLRFLILELCVLNIVYIDRSRMIRSRLRILDLVMLTLLNIYCEEELWFTQQLFEGYIIVLSAVLVIDCLRQRFQ